MKKSYSIIRNILAIIGGIAIIAAIIVWIESPNYDFYLEKNNVGLYDEHVELLLSADIKARYITCMPEDKDDPDCHVVNEVWLPELNKWAMIDTDMGGHYVTDRNGTPLSLKEMRENYISGKKMLMHPAFGKAQKDNDYYAYMAKNTYWFACWGTLSYYQEEYKVEGVDRNSYVILVPSGFEPFDIGGGNTVTTNAEKFWDTAFDE